MEIKSIQKRISDIEQLKAEAKIANEALSTALANDSSYQATVSEAKEVNAKKKRLREDIVNQAENREYMERLKDLKDEIATLEELLAYELVEYARQNNTDMIEGTDGFVRKFKILVRLLPGRGFDGQEVES